jgi:hypothetical protein
MPKSNQASFSPKFQFLYSISVGLFWKICIGYVQWVYAGYIDERTQKEAQN